MIVVSRVARFLIIARSITPKTHNWTEQHNIASQIAGLRKAELHRAQDFMIAEQMYEQAFKRLLTACEEDE